MAYKTTKAILDSQDDLRHYEEGATFPASGVEVSKERIADLVSRGYLVADDVKKPVKKTTKKASKE